MSDNATVLGDDSSSSSSSSSVVVISMSVTASSDEISFVGIVSCGNELKSW